MGSWWCFSCMCDMLHQGHHCFAAYAINRPLASCLGSCNDIGMPCFQIKLLKLSWICVVTFMVYQVMAYGCMFMHVHYFHGIHQANVLWPTGSEGAFLASRIAIMVMHVTNASSCMCIVQAMCDIYLLGSIWLAPSRLSCLHVPSWHTCAFMNLQVHIIISSFSWYLDPSHSQWQIHLLEMWGPDCLTEHLPPKMKLVATTV